MIIRQHGFWVLYEPEQLPEGLPPGSGILFLRRQSDGVDWYDFLRTEPNDLKPDTVKMTVTQLADPRGQEHWVILTASRDATMLFPENALIIEVEGIDLGVNLIEEFGQRTFNPETNEIGPTLPPLFAPLSRRQFFQIGALTGLITYDEALAAVQHGMIPAKIQAYIDTISDPQYKFSVQMLIAGAGEFDRYHPMTEGLGHYLGVSAEQLDEMWKQGATL